jgi:MFS transporter, Spinster family, sphingosine-1-phosphate transporter
MSADPVPPPSHHAGRYLSLALLFAAGALNLCDRQIVNILAQSIKSEMHISDAQLGLLTGTAFGLFYSVLGIPLGRLADRTDRVKLMAGVLALWSAFTGLCGYAGSFAQLFLLRMGVGVGEAGSQPASTALVADLFPAHQRTSALAVLLVGAPVGGFLGLFVGGYVGSVWGWRTAFVVAAIPGFVLALIMLLTMGDPKRALPAGAISHIPLRLILRDLLVRPRFRWLIIGLVCSSFFPYAGGAWLPSHFIRVFGMSTAEMGRYAGYAVGVGGALGTLGAGYLCDKLRSRLREAELVVLIAALAISLATLLAATLSSGLVFALTSLFVMNLCAYAFLGPVVMLIQTEATAISRALAVAVGVAISNILNLGVVVPLVGLISDGLRVAHGPRSVGVALALAALGMGGLGLIAYSKAYRSKSRN